MTRGADDPNSGAWLSSATISLGGTDASEADIAAADEALAATARARVGTLVGNRWRITGFIGAGGMGLVYEARHDNGHRVAVKVLRPEFASDPIVAKRFRREAYISNRVQHSGAISVLDDGLLADGMPYLVMPLLRGTSVAALRDPALEDVLRVADRVLDVLVAAHEKGITHRDLKPANLFLSDDGNVYVLDFGIARVTEPTEGETITRTGTTLGTLHYMAPEQARGPASAVDHRADLWSLGATVFALLANRPVHVCENRQRLLIMAMRDPAAPVRSVLPNLPDAVAEWLDKSLSFRREDRYQTALEMQATLRTLRRHRSLRPSIPATAPKATSTHTDRTRAGLSSRLRVAVAAPLAATVVAVLVWLAVPREDSPMPGIVSRASGSAETERVAGSVARPQATWESARSAWIDAGATAVGSPAPATSADASAQGSPSARSTHTRVVRDASASDAAFNPASFSRRDAGQW